MIADITDLNPNVMVELGLRLASKKPTIVIMEEDGIIPFDIRDFHILSYPKGFNILRMEKFLSALTDNLRDIGAAFADDKYVPFLSKVVVDVVAPDERNVSMNQYVLS